MLRADGGQTRADLAPRRRSSWVDLALVVVALVLLLRGFGAVVEGSEWWLTGTLVMLLTAATCGMLHTFAVRMATPAGLLAVLLSSTWVFVPGTTVVGIPTPDTFREMYGLLGDAGGVIAGEEAPVAAASSIVFLLALSFGLIVVVVDLLLRHRASPLTIGAVLIAVYITPALVAGRTPSLLLFLVAAAAWLLLLRRQTHDARGSGWLAGLPALGVAAAALAVSIALPPVLPEVPAVAAAWGNPPPSVFGRGINPMLELGQNLRRSSPVVSLELTTTASAAPYLKVATLSDFSGRTWAPSETAREDRFEDEVEIDPDVDRTTDETTIDIRGLRSPMLPVPYPALEVSGVDGSWRWERAGMTLRAERGSRDQHYEVSSLSLEPTADQMRAADAFVDRDLERYVDLPDRMPQIITDTARQVTEGAATNYDRALALQSFLRGPDFEYSETAPVAQGYDGNGISVIAEFLQKKSGYCVHFSSTMSVMARSLGIPARVAVGFAPAETSRLVGGSEVYDVQSDQLHAWSELYFEDIGWVRFDPTPGIGEATSFVEPVGESTAIVPGSTDDSAAAGEQALDAQLAADQVDAGSSAGSETSTVPRTALVVLPGLVLVAAAPGLLRAWRRRRRLSDGSPDALWRELQDTARDIGLGVSSNETPRAFADRLSGHLRVDDDGLDRLLVSVETSRFARPGTLTEAEPRADLQRVLDSLWRAVPRPRRWRAQALPPSLMASPQSRRVDQSRVTLT